MTLVLNGTTGVSSVDGSAGTPAVQGTDTNTGVFFPAADTVAISTGGSERMRVDSSGTVNISGTVDPLLNLNNTGTGSNALWFSRSGALHSALYATNAGELNVRNFQSQAMLFWTNNTERMRITSGGELLVGLTAGGSSGAKLQAYNSSTGNCLSARVSDNGFAPFAAYNASDSVIFYVSGGGSIYAINTAITAISDERHKENIRDLDTGLEQVLALRPRRFDWKEGRGDGKKDVVGFIAQEVEPVLPDIVGEWKEDLSKEESWKALATGNMIPTLVKAIQELNSKIDALESRIAALEAAE